MPSSMWVRLCPTTRTLAIVGLCLSAYVAVAETAIVVSQKNRRFDPGEITVNKGDTITVVNDDGDLLHHAYVESDNFNFDSGDQNPGSRTPITFTQRGDFRVLCGIHPKMKLVVHVH